MVGLCKPNADAYVEYTAATNRNHGIGPAAAGEAGIKIASNASKNSRICHEQTSRRVGQDVATGKPSIRP